MIATFWQVLFFSLVGGVFSLVGGALLLSRRNLAFKLARYVTPFAAGALLAAAFFDLLPEASELITVSAATRWALLGLVIFFLLEHFLHWFHHHHEHPSKHNPTATLIIIGDSLHNLIDGIAIGAAFLINVPTGIVTTVAIAAHEIPQEIGDFGLLLKLGYKRAKILWVNIFSALMTVVGALLIYGFGRQNNLPLAELLAVTAGMFIYIAASDLIPSIHEESKGKLSHLAVALLLVGIMSVGVLTEIAHERIEANKHELCVEPAATELEAHSAACEGLEEHNH